jgi:hypothetical protein
MSSSDQGEAAAAEPVAEETPVVDASTNGKVYASRDDLLNAAGKLAEEELYVEEIGWLLLSEISGDARADIVGQSASAMQKGELDVKSYQRALLLAGVVDPSSPVGNRRPLFRPGDIDRIMKIGSQKLLSIIDTVEKLSAMGQYQGGVEGNSETTPSAAGTSG